MAGAHPTLKIPDNLPQTQDMPVRITVQAPTEGVTPAKRTPDEEARDILAAAAKNQVESRPGTRRAAVRACKYLRTLVNRYGSVIDEVHSQARLHTQRSKGVVEHGKWYQPTGEALPVISKEVTSELLHCLTALPDPWPLAKITIDLEKPGQWVTKCAIRTDRIPSKLRGPAVEAAIEEVEEILPKLEARMIEFLAEWSVSLLMPAQSVFVKNVNPSTPRVYPNPRFHIKHYARRKHLLWLRLRSYLIHCNVKIKELVPPRLLSARQISFFSLQTPQSQGTGQQEPRTAHSRETQTGNTAQKQRGYCFNCPR